MNDSNAMRTLRNTLLAIACVAGLSGCGGGGGTSDSNAGQATALPGNLVTVVPSPSYALNSEELKAFQLLNAERSRCGFGLIAQNNLLDSAARAHARWNLINNQVSHLEDGSTFPNGFTGATPAARASFQGFSGQFSVGEVMASRASLSVVGMGEGDMRGLLNAPFHLAYLMSDFSDLGISVQSPVDVGQSSGNSLLVADLGYSLAVGRQDPASDVVQTYPCDGSSGVKFELAGEVPNPVTGRDLKANPLGVSVLIRVRNGQTLSVSSASMKEVSTGLSVELRPMVGGVNGVADTILGVFGTSKGYIAANVAMKPNTAYTMNIVGANNGTAFSKNFTFTTGQ